MARHQIKTQVQIEEEIRRRAQGAADAAEAGITIPRPQIAASAEPNMYGSHWIVAAIAEPGVRYVERAAVQISRIWDIRPS